MKEGKKEEERGQEKTMKGDKGRIRNEDLEMRILVKKAQKLKEKD
jgi:hypothetical protein